MTNTWIPVLQCQQLSVDGPRLSYVDPCGLRSSELLQLLATNLLITSTPSVETGSFLLALGGKWWKLRKTRAAQGKCSRGLEKVILKYLRKYHISPLHPFASIYIYLHLCIHPFSHCFFSQVHLIIRQLAGQGYVWWTSQRTSTIFAVN